MSSSFQQNDGQSSDRSSPSFSSAQRRFTEHLSPPGTSSPSGSVASKRPLQPSRPVFLRESLQRRVGALRFARLTAETLPFTDPTVSRLRSHNRHISTSTVNTLSSLPPGAPYSGASSHFSQLSRSESSSTINSILHPNRLSDDSTSPSLTYEQPAPPPPPTDEDVFRWSTLQRISLALYPQPTTAKSSSKLQTLAVGQLPPGLRREQLGHPTKMVAGGLVCVGMSSGFVGVWDFRGEAKGWFGNETLRECYPRSPSVALQHLTHLLLVCGSSLGRRPSDGSRDLIRPHLHRRRPRGRPRLPLPALLLALDACPLGRTHPALGHQQGPQGGPSEGIANPPRWVRREASYRRRDRGRQGHGVLPLARQGARGRLDGRVADPRKLPRSCSSAIIHARLFRRDASSTEAQDADDPVCDVPSPACRRLASFGGRPPLHRPPHTRQARHRRAQTESEDVVPADACGRGR